MADSTSCQTPGHCLTVSVTLCWTYQHITITTSPICNQQNQGSWHYPNHHSLKRKRPNKNIIERISFKQYNCLTMIRQGPHLTWKSGLGNQTRQWYTKNSPLKYDRITLSFLDQRKKQMFHYLSSVNKPLDQRHIAIHCKVLKRFESGKSTGLFNYFWENSGCESRSRK